MFLYNYITILLRVENPFLFNNLIIILLFFLYYYFYALIKIFQKSFFIIS